MYLAKLKGLQPGELRLLEEIQKISKGQFAFEEAKYKSGNIYHKVVATNPMLFQMLALRLSAMAEGRRIMQAMMEDKPETPKEETNK